MSTTGAVYARILSIFLATAVTAAASSLGYRGIDNCGVYPAKGLLKEWPEDGPELLWKYDAQLGYCGVNVVDERVYIVEGVGQCKLSVFSLDGKLIKKTAMGSAAWKRFGGSRSTPLVAEGIVVATLPNADVYGFDLETLEQRWKKKRKQRKKRMNRPLPPPPPTVIDLTGDDETTNNILFALQQDDDPLLRELASALFTLQ